MELNKTDQDCICELCGKKHKGKYILIPTSDKEYEALIEDFGAPFEESPVAVVCEECLQGSCYSDSGCNAAPCSKQFLRYLHTTDLP